MSDPDRNRHAGPLGDDAARRTADDWGVPATRVAQDAERWDEAGTGRARASAKGPSTDDRSLGELFGALSRDLGDLFRSEVELARTELAEEARKASRAGGMLAGGVATAYLALILAASAAAWGLSEVIDAGWAFLVVAAALGAIAAVLLMKGRDELRSVRPVPDETVETLKEDAQWARAQVK
jgi:hypothetical protein